MDEARANYAERLIDAIAEAEVMSIFFLRAGHALVLDFRRDAASPPLVTVDQIAPTPYERLTSLGRLRPSLALPDEITLAPWAETASELAQSGVLDALERRCRQAGGEPLCRSLERAYATIVRMERRALTDLIRGVGLETIWQRGDDASSPMG